MKNLLISGNNSVRKAPLVVAFFGIPAFLGILTGCLPTNQQNASQDKTDLGSNNDLVAGRYRAYTQAPPEEHCSLPTDSTISYRVLLTGFAPFQGVSINISGLVAMNYADVQNKNPPVTQNPDLGGKDAIIKQGVVNIGGTNVAVCAIESSVNWDLSSAIFLLEANNFKPNFIIMSGLNPNKDDVGTWEVSAVNQAGSTPGFNSDGSKNTIAAKQSDNQNPPAILEGGDDSIPMTWKANDLAKAANDVVKKDDNAKAKLLGFSFEIGQGKASIGDYICNNVSYIVLEGLTGKPLPLAGNKLMIQANKNTDAKTGFFHYPSNAPGDSDGIKSWVAVLTAAIQSQMQNN